MLGDSLTKRGYPARGKMENFLRTKRWRITYDPHMQSERKRAQQGIAPLANPVVEEEEVGRDMVELLNEKNNNPITAAAAWWLIGEKGDLREEREEPSEPLRNESEPPETHETLATVQSVSPEWETNHAELLFQLKLIQQRLCAG